MLATLYTARGFGFITGVVVLAVVVVLDADARKGLAAVVRDLISPLKNAREFNRCPLRR